MGIRRCPAATCPTSIAVRITTTTPIAISTVALFRSSAIVSGFVSRG